MTDTIIHHKESNNIITKFTKMYKNITKMLNSFFQYNYIVLIDRHTNNYYK